VNHRIFERKLRSRGLTPREHVRLSAASIYPFNKSHSTHRAWWNWGNGLYHRRRRWHGLRLCMVRLCPNTHRYIYYRVRGSHVLLSSVSVGRLVVCVFCVWGCCPHTPGIAVCAAAALLRLPPFIGRRLCMACTLNSIMPCLCAWMRSHIYRWCVCLAQTPTPPPTLSNTRTRMHMSSRACIPKVICICEHGHSICT
jgi:hypothetical protein